ncbi:3-carboxy-cis,cis-muconate cycloisomerase [Mycolicibacterium smegmatis]|uniref:3-carboxy-cis,cis-muconate cycloisomerase n=1 Tax=Mycolicibacterium smegmatis TaxID=1772 RepID=UPI0005D78875|nr:3-carboxy-cis,cis-muconate cycloisomerase [Mycolicibacterium smegmatis]MDF1901088.1 3-carboxy-cis,cis-muconate cycloisomerase [Mycolicibacterium smegmatis]MDF1907264.1 3-carboxy-cis,cis-muconate cycloisomerase [Mycolicibacterium smegmatis]MDF1917536.1 3-carboxy-cis,cis-muconate cycloisomerase [Mycolicibacterium smegmatis]MDF1925526.1 3-carboxy-cis,cis-muconate cycloisomerase [Mycolicibacterium smegmatis]UAK54636.1 3-carboxy-cis,cis-muconate cycloisomerase [Mycolicibacterium smegmatis]
MTDLLWPGDHRAGDLMSDRAFFDAMVAVENAWLNLLVDIGPAPQKARVDLCALTSAGDVETVAAGAESDGNPVVGLVALLRERAGGEAARWLHRGLTSQDVVDTALMMCLRDALSAVHDEMATHVRILLGLVESHRSSPMTARTLTQPALPSTAAAKFANWLSGVLDAADALAAVPWLPVQLGGAVGTHAATTELVGSPDETLTLADALAGAVGLTPAAPWHTTRAVVTRAGDALVGCCDACGHIAADVAVGSRAEIGELVEGSGGASSTMPHKRNPVLSVLIRRAALAAPALGATLHAASAASVDERSDGGWHAEWAALRTLTRRTVVAMRQTSDLLTGLHVDVQRARDNLGAAGDLLAEQRVMSELVGRTTRADYLGASGHLIDAVAHRARRHLKETM